MISKLHGPANVREAYHKFQKFPGCGGLWNTPQQCQLIESDGQHPQSESDWEDDDYASQSSDWSSPEQEPSTGTEAACS